MPRPPATGRVTSPYGPRDGSAISAGVGPFHYGEDRNGDGNYAPEAGTVVFAGYAGAFGNAILIRVGNVVWNLAHHKNLNGRARGQRVAEGAFLAPMGATGLAVGVHVHTERRVNGGDTIQSGAHTNPALYYSSVAGGGSTPFVPPKPKGRIVPSIITAKDSGGHVFYFEGGFVKHLASVAEVQAMSWALDDARTNRFDNLDFQRALWGFGLEEFTVDQVLDLSGRNGGPAGRFLVASWRDARKVSAVVDTDALAGKVAELVTGRDVAVVREAVAVAIAEAAKKIAG
jgi:hypothetical protein